MSDADWPTSALSVVRYGVLRQSNLPLTVVRFVEGPVTQRDQAIELAVGDVVIHRSDEGPVAAEVTELGARRLTIADAVHVLNVVEHVQIKSCPGGSAHPR